MVHFKVFGRFLLEYGGLALKTRRLPSNTLFLQAAYRTFLKREIDDEGLNYYLHALQRKSITRQAVLTSIIQSSEFKRVHGFPIHPADAVHQSRMMLFQQYLPPAQVIVDLGGAAHDHPEGALLAMGYPHRPHEIIIVDLPPADRIDGAERAELSQEMVTEDGIRVSYLYRSMADLSPIADQSVDLVVSGESIEHVSESDVDLVCQEVYRILKPGEYFCLDTPNAALTRLQSPNELIHPEHKKEYYVHELKDKLEHWGFKIVEAKGICPMPQSLQSGVFDFAEMIRNIGLSENPEEGYLFYLKAIKPAPLH
jgi:SAM-dependent methyltransferase